MKPNSKIANSGVQWSLGSFSITVASCGLPALPDLLLLLLPQSECSVFKQIVACNVRCNLTGETLQPPSRTPRWRRCPKLGVFLWVLRALHFGTVIDRCCSDLNRSTDLTTVVIVQIERTPSPPLRYTLPCPASNGVKRAIMNEVATSNQNRGIKLSYITMLGQPLRA